jgi:hypothetical protein
MNARTASGIAFVVLGIALVTWRMLAPAPVPAATPKPAGNQPRAKKALAKVASDRDWKKVSAEELREMSAWFGDAKTPRSFEVDTVVAPGEAVLAEVYEATPGELVFTKLTPVVKTRADGARYVEVTMDSFSVAASGEFRNLLSHQVSELRPGDSYVAASVAYGKENSPAGIYDVGVSVDIDGEPPSVRLRANGSYQKAGAPPENKGAGGDHRRERGDL